MASELFSRREKRRRSPVPVVRVLAALQLLSEARGTANTTTATTNTGNTLCPCTSPDLSTWLDAPSGKLKATVGAKDYLYTATYGLGHCQPWDADKPPACALADGTVLANAPDWCGKHWCYVDPANCGPAFSAAQSSYFLGSSLYYSYQTCGASNSFVTWSTTNSDAGKMLTTVENTLRTLKSEIESHFVALHDGSISSAQQSTCTAHFDLNTCTSCPSSPTGTGWVGASAVIDFTKTGAFISDMSDTKLKCLHDGIRLQFLKVVNSEYDMVAKDRVAYLYMGFADKGDYIQWPAMQWTRGGYDPRYRPWYAMIASGPKNVIITIDKSGSMDQQNRLPLAKEAAIKVLGTLTWLDYFLVLAFSSDVSACAPHLIPATESNINAAKNWINALSAQGTTNFVASLGTSLDLAKQGSVFEDGVSDMDRCFSAQCKTVVLFLSDGIPDSWGANDYTTLQNKGLPSSFKLFTYALGSGADTTVLAQLAANHGGEIRTVTDGGNLPDTMADYYKKLADDRDINAVRWMRYSDIVSGQTLLAGCVSIDDLRTTATVKAMVAVACMDANIIAPLSQLESLNGYTDFLASYERNSRMCANGNNPFAEMSSLQCSVRWETIQVCAPGENCLEADAKEDDEVGAVVLAIIGGAIAFCGLCAACACVCLRCKEAAAKKTNSNFQTQNSTVQMQQMGGPQRPSPRPGYGMQPQNQQFQFGMVGGNPNMFVGGQPGGGMNMNQYGPSNTFGAPQNTMPIGQSGSPRPGVGMNQNAGGGRGGGAEPMIVVLDPRNQAKT